MNNMTIYSASDARLPVNYEAAKMALEECVRVDECKEWKDRAAAIASYARQKRDRSLFEKAERIKARATRRLGELINDQAEARNQPIRKVAEESGITPIEASTARAVARIKHRVFEQKVEASPPARVSHLAKLGSNPRGADESGPIWKLTERLRVLTNEYPIEVVKKSAAGLTTEQRSVIKRALTPTAELFDALSQWIGL
jgi:hypothetical protein